MDYNNRHAFGGNLGPPNYSYHTKPVHGGVPSLNLNYGTNEHAVGGGSLTVRDVINTEVNHGRQDEPALTATAPLTERRTKKEKRDMYSNLPLPFSIKATPRTNEEEGRGDGANNTASLVHSVHNGVTGTVVAASHDLNVFASGSKKSLHGSNSVVLSNSETIAFPLTAAGAIKNFRHLLTDYELGEILEHKQVYYLGKSAEKKVKGSVHSQYNDGYDDERGDYTINIGDHIAYRFEIVDLLGKGSFGQVVKVKDHKTGESFALKIIRNKKRFHKQAMTEVKILTYLKDMDTTDSNNVIRIEESFPFRNHLCITFPLLSKNLYEFIKQNDFKGVSLGLVRRFAIQILSSLAFFNKHKIVHCDLKPENILLKQQNKSGIKVIDLGSSCFENERVYTYIQSRFYRSPEVILGMQYGMPIDIWSFGCILAELYTGILSFF